MNNELDSLLAQRTEITDQIKKVAKEEFGAVIAGLFESEPALENFAWLQYQHEYNDGIYPWLISTNTNDIDEDNHYVDIGYAPEDPLNRRVSAEWKKFPDWLLIELFGDDQYVIVYPDRVETLDYWD